MNNNPTLLVQYNGRTVLACSLLFILSSLSVTNSIRLAIDRYDTLQRHGREHAIGGFPSLVQDTENQIASGWQPRAQVHQLIEWLDLLGKLQALDDIFKHR